MTLKIALSIIIPVYNVQDYLIDCLDSILQSKGNHNIEIILIDDGSTDKSGYICDTYCKKFSFVKVIHQENLGLSCARNCGIKYAKGKWLTFIDSDDKVVCNYIDLIFDLIKENKDLTFFGYQTFVKALKKKKITYRKSDLAIISKSQSMYYITTEKWGNYAWNKIYKKQLFNGIKYPPNKNYEDIYTTFKLINKASTFLVFNEKLYFYRQRSGSIINSTNIEQKIKNLEDSIKSRRYQIDFFDKHNYTDAKRNAYYYLANQCSEYIKLTNNNSIKHGEIYSYCVNLIKKLKLKPNTWGIKWYFKRKLIQISPKLFSKVSKIKF